MIASSSIYLVVYGCAEFQYILFDSYQNAMFQLRRYVLNNPRFTPRLVIYRRNEYGYYLREVESDDEW